MGSVSAAEILSLETYYELVFLATNQKFQTEIKKQRLAEFRTNEYFENIKNKCWGAVSPLGFSWSFPPPRERVLGHQESTKWEKLEYCNT